MFKKKFDISLLKKIENERLLKRENLRKERLREVKNQVEHYFINLKLKSVYLTGSILEKTVSQIIPTSILQLKA